MRPRHKAAENALANGMATGKYDGFNEAAA